LLPPVVSCELQEEEEEEEMLAKWNHAIFTWHTIFTFLV
jgi:hypothetical protein